MRDLSRVAAGALPHKIAVSSDLEKELTVNSDLHQHVRPSTNAAGVVHVIFVWKIRRKSAFHDKTGGETFGSRVYLSDGIPDPGKNLAHEIGHLLTQDHEGALGYVDRHLAKSGLMDPTASSTRITRREAECMYKDATFHKGWGAYLDTAPATARGPT